MWKQGRRKKSENKYSLEHADWECKNSYSKTCRKNMLKIRGLCSTVFAFFCWNHTNEGLFFGFSRKFHKFMCFRRNSFSVWFHTTTKCEITFIQSQKNASSCTPAIVRHNFKSRCLFSDNKNPTTFFLSHARSLFLFIRHRMYISKCGRNINNVRQSTVMCSP